MIILISILVVLGIAGSVLPALPGPVLSYAALVLLFVERGEDAISVTSLIVFGALMVVLIIFDYLAPIIGAKFFGASKKGLIGAIIGGLIGIVFFPPLGVFLGAFLGAFIGEIYDGKKNMKALKAGIGTLLGSAFILFLQVLYSVSVAIYFFLKIF